MGAVLTSSNMAGKLYFDPELPIGFSTLNQLQAAAKDSKIGKMTGELRAWLEAQKSYTLHRHVRKRFPRNPYSANTIMEVWECDLVDV